MIEVIQLQFERDEVVITNIRALFFCPKASTLVSDAYDSREPLRYVPLSLEHADILVCHMDEDFGEADPVDDSREMTPPRIHAA